MRAVYAVAQSAVTSARRAHARAVFFSVFSLARAAEFAKLACTAAQTVAAAAAAAKASRNELCRSRFRARALTRAAASHAPLQPVMPPGSALKRRCVEVRQLHDELDWDVELPESQLTPRALPQPSALVDGGGDFIVVVRRSSARVLARARAAAAAAPPLRALSLALADAGADADADADAAAAPQPLGFFDLDEPPPLSSYAEDADANAALILSAYAAARAPPPRTNPPPGDAAARPPLSLLDVGLVDVLDAKQAAAADAFRARGHILRALDWPLWRWDDAADADASLSAADAARAPRPPRTTNPPPRDADAPPLRGAARAADADAPPLRGAARAADADASLSAADAARAPPPRTTNPPPRDADAPRAPPTPTRR